MASTPDSRRFSYRVFSTSSTERKKKASQQRPSTPHYRPVSSILSQASASQPPSSRLSGESIRSLTMKEPIKNKGRVSFESLSTSKPSLSFRSKSPEPGYGSDRIFPRQNIFSKLKMKRSMSALNPASYNSQQNNDAVSSQPFPPFAMNLSTPDLRKPAANKDKWIRKNYATLHPYPQEAPYMQAYDPIPLDNDRYTDLLLRRLMPNGSPTFHDYGSKPPQSVLDLGCGVGHWVFYAADVWKTSQFIGFDLVDLTSHMEKPDNVTFVKGNFLKQRLPFANKQFDLVRMANLSLCIPHAKWEALLMEVFRVLAVGGRLELIDDEIIFPYGPTPESDSKQSKPVVQSVFDDFDDDDDDTLEGDSGDADVTLVNVQDTLAERYTGKISPLSIPKSTKRHSDSSSMDDFALVSPTLAETPMDEHSAGIMSTWAHQASECHHLETIFEKMLKAKYDIHSRPSVFLQELILFVFGGNVEKERTFQLKLAPKNADEFYGLSTSSESKEILSDREDDWSSNSSDSGVGFPSRKTSMERDMGHMSDRVSAKAAGRLGITYSALAAAAAASVRQRIQTTPTQSPGIILWPSTYFPMPPSELEMHACKNLHVLLGCKHALAEYIQTFKEQDGKNSIEDGICNDLLWEYECFRRRRFHWPADVPDMRLEIRSAAFNGLQRRGSSTNRSKHLASAESSICPYTEDELTDIRTIHVYEALKSDDYSMANLQYPRYPVPSPPKPKRFLFC